MTLQQKQKDSLMKIITSRISTIIHANTLPTDNGDVIHEKSLGIENLLKLLCNDDYNDKFLRCPTRYNDSALYNFWALIHEPGKLPKELGWINERSGVETQNLIEEIQQFTINNYSSIFNYLIEILIEERSEEALIDDSMSLDASEKIDDSDGPINTSRESMDTSIEHHNPYDDEEMHRGGDDDSHQTLTIKIS